MDAVEKQNAPSDTGDVVERLLDQHAKVSPHDLSIGTALVSLGWITDFMKAAEEAAVLIKRLEAERDEAVRDYHTAYDGSLKFLDQTKAAESERDAALARVKELEGVLKPFADSADACLDDTDLDGANAWEHAVSMGVTIGDFRHARATLKDKADDRHD